MTNCRIKVHDISQNVKQETRAPLQPDGSVCIAKFSFSSQDRYAPSFLATIILGNLFLCSPYGEGRGRIIASMVWHYSDEQTYDLSVTCKSELFLQFFSFATMIVCAIHGDLMGQPRYRRRSDSRNSSEEDGRLGKKDVFFNA